MEYAFRGRDAAQAASMPTPPSDEVKSAHPKRPRSSPSPEPRDALVKRPRPEIPLIAVQTRPQENRQLTEYERKKDQLIFWRTMATISGVPPGKAHMVQLQQAFIDSYFSSGVISSHRQYFNTFYWLSPQSAAMSASRDALCFIHLGSRRRNLALVHEGLRHHLAAIHCLRQELARPGATTDDAVLGANYTLGQTEVFLAVSRTNSQINTHMAGLQNLLLHRGPESIKTPFAQALLYNIRSVSVMHGLLSRKPQFLAEEKWRIAAKPGWQGKTTLSAELTNLSLLIPELLQRADSLSAAKKAKAKKDQPAEMEIVGLLTELSKLELGIQQWLLKFYKVTGVENSPYRLRSVLSDAFFRLGLGNLVHVFPMMLEFPTFLSATTHVWVWSCLLILRETILDVASLHPYPTVRAQNQEASLLANVDECAVALCQTIAYLIHPEHASCGIVACSAPLHFSARWFERQGQTERLTWTKHVRGFLQRDILLSGGYDTSVNINMPFFLWWMLPDIAVEDEEDAGSDRVTDTEAAGD